MLFQILVFYYSYFTFSQETSMDSFNPQPAEGGPIGPLRIKIVVSPELKVRLTLKPGSKFKFVHHLETYLLTLTILGHEGTLQGSFL